MILLSARTGLVEALLLDNGYLTDVRTAAAGAVAARHLARPDATVAAIFGAGMLSGLKARLLLQLLLRAGADAGERGHRGVDLAQFEAAAVLQRDAGHHPAAAPGDLGLAGGRGGAGRGRPRRRPAVLRR